MSTPPGITPKPPDHVAWAPPRRDEIIGWFLSPRPSSLTWMLDQGGPFLSSPCESSLCRDLPYVNSILFSTMSVRSRDGFVFLHPCWDSLELPQTKQPECGKKRKRIPAPSWVPGTVCPFEQPMLVAPDCQWSRLCRHWLYGGLPADAGLWPTDGRLCECVGA